jgi:hypothetical protein
MTGAVAPVISLCQLEGDFMASTSVPTVGFAEGNFGVSRVLRRSAWILRRYLLPFSAVTAVVNLPVLLLVEGEAIAADTSPEFAVRLSLAFLLSFVLGTLGQAGHSASGVSGHPWWPGQPQ